MKSIHEELFTAFQNIADNHGVAIFKLDVKWMDVSTVKGQRFNVNNIITSDSTFIQPKAKIN